MNRTPLHAQVLAALHQEGETTAEASAITPRGFTIVLGKRYAHVYVHNDRVTVAASASRGTVTLGHGTPAKDIARIIREGLAPSALTYRDVAGKTIYLVRHLLGDRPHILCLATTERNAMRVASKHHRLALTSYAASPATEDESGRHETVLLDSGDVVPIANVLRAIATIR
jgi:hypothetical protein